MVAAATGTTLTYKRCSTPFFWNTTFPFTSANKVWSVPVPTLEPARTGVPLLLTTSFNEHEPIVCTPADALRCFTKNHMDVLVLGPFYLEWVKEADERATGAGG